ncbi:MAG: ABC transporter substrate-binding protein [Selenomonas artemidis]|mgnify:FL=1
MRKAGIITALLCLAAAALFLLWPRAQQPPEPQELTVTDSTGRQVTLPTHPQRVVILNPSNLDLYVAAGGAENVVGKPTSQALSETVKEKTAAAEEVGIIHQPDMEKILALQPDLIIGTNVPFHTALEEALSNVGVPLYIQALDDVPSLFGALELYGRLTGHEDDAAAQIAAIRQKLDAVKKKADGRTPPKNLLVFGAPDSFNMGTSKCFTGGLIEMLGGGNIADRADGDGAYLPISMEFVARENPAVIFVIVHGPADTLEPKMRRELQESEAWADVDAVKNGRVYVLPYELFAVNPGIRAADALQTLADIMYPTPQ